METVSKRNNGDRRLLFILAVLTGVMTIGLPQRTAAETAQETVQEQHYGNEIQRATSAKTKWGSATRTGSPIHQNNNNETKSDNTEDEDKSRRCVIA